MYITNTNNTKVRMLFRFTVFCLFVSIRVWDAGMGGLVQMETNAIHLTRVKIALMAPTSVVLTIQRTKKTRQEI